MSDQTHEWDFPGGHAIVSTLAAGTPDHPDFNVAGPGGGCFTGDICAVFAAEILRLRKQLDRVCSRYEAMRDAWRAS